MTRGGISNRFLDSRVGGGHGGYDSSGQQSTNPMRESELDLENVVDLGRNTPSSRGTRDHSYTIRHGQRGLPVAYVYLERLFPDGVARTCWPVFLAKMDTTGYYWKVVSPATEEIYFQDFKTKKNGGVEPPLYELEKKIHMSKKTRIGWTQKPIVYEMVTSQVETLKEQLANSQGESE